jgi:hypothetical protein
MTNFDQVKNDAASTLAANYTPGSGSFLLAAGAGANFPTPTPTNPIRIAVMPAAKAYNPATLAPADMRIYQATGKSGDTLTGIAAIEGYADDKSFTTGDAVAMTITAGTIGDIQGAVNALENATTSASVAANVVYAGPTSGGSAAPAFRAIVAADVPSLDAGKITTGTFATARLPAMVGSGVSHAAGIVPDPGAVAGTAKFLREDATWAAPPAGAPGGSDTQVQYNAAGSFAGDAGLTYNAATDTLSVVGAADGRRVIIRAFSAQTTNLVEIQNSAGTPASYVQSNALWVLGNGTILAGLYCYSNAIQNAGDGGNVTWSTGSGASAIPLTLTSYGSTGVNTRTVVVTGSHVNENLLTVTALASHVGDLQRWQDSSNNNLLRVDKAGRLVSGAATPSIAVGTGAGTGPTVSVAGSDQAGTINVTTGTTPTAAATIVAITFATAYGVTPKAVLLTPANAATAALAVGAQPFEDSSVRATGSFVLKANGTALTASTAYKWNYLVL